MKIVPCNSAIDSSADTELLVWSSKTEKTFVRKLIQNESNRNQITVTNNLKVQSVGVGGTAANLSNKSKSRVETRNSLSRAALPLYVAVC